MSEHLHHFAAVLAEEAGALARRHFFRGRFVAERKKNGEWVTDVDREVEDFIAQKLRDKFPQHGILGEENGGGGDQDNCWVIDPIDGTTNFIHQYPQCSVSIAFCHRGRPVAGAIHDIAANETFVAASGQGAYLGNRRLRVSGMSSVGDSVFVASGIIGGPGFWSLMETMARRSSGMRRGGSTALDLAAVAAGRADMTLCGPVKYWDVAAGTVILREAGGLLADVDDQTAFSFGAPTKCFAAGAPGVFTPYLNELKKHCRQ